MVSTARARVLGSYSRGIGMSPFYTPSPRESHPGGPGEPDIAVEDDRHGDLAHEGLEAALCHEGRR